MSNTEGASAPSLPYVDAWDEYAVDALPPEMTRIPPVNNELRVIGMGSNGQSLFGKVKKKPYQDWVWRNIDGIKIPLCKMNRPHVQNCLNWCIRRGGNPSQTWKDGHTYQEWITAFTVQLFDPKCK